jgi:hypothetical protein
MVADRPIMRFILWSLAVACVASGCARTTACRNSGRPFDYRSDTFAFANETVWKYGDEIPATHDGGSQENMEKYTRRCFLLASSVLQFWKFARFEPTAPPVEERILADRIRKVRSLSVWHDSLPAERRVVFPGYANLREFSERHGALLRATLGPGWTTYFEPRKFSMPFVPSRSHQEKTHEMLQDWLRHGQPVILWLYNFPNVNINHAVTVFGETTSPGAGQYAYAIYDPNYTDAPRVLVYDPATRTFSYGTTFYFSGGQVRVRPMYLGPLR